MKRIYSLTIVLALICCFAVHAHATLIVRGTDSLGNQLIYDTDRNITWYDYTQYMDLYSNMVDWASNLSVNFNGVSLTGWRLPVNYSPNVVGGNFDCLGPWVCTNDELGHLFYDEFGNTREALRDFVISTGPFNNISFGGVAQYATGTEMVQTPPYWYGGLAHLVYIFDMQTGESNVNNIDNGDGRTWPGLFTARVIAVRPGDVAVPELGTLLLLGSGLVGLIAGRKMFRRHDG